MVMVRVRVRVRVEVDNSEHIQKKQITFLGTAALLEFRRARTAGCRSIADPQRHISLDPGAQAFDTGLNNRHGGFCVSVCVCVCVRVLCCVVLCVVGCGVF